MSGTGAGVVFTASADWWEFVERNGEVKVAEPFTGDWEAAARAAGVDVDDAGAWVALVTYADERYPAVEAGDFACRQGARSRVMFVRVIAPADPQMDVQAAPGAAVGEARAAPVRPPGTPEGAAPQRIGAPPTTSPASTSAFASGLAAAFGSPTVELDLEGIVPPQQGGLLSPVAVPVAVHGSTPIFAPVFSPLLTPSLPPYEVGPEPPPGPRETGPEGRGSTAGPQQERRE